MTTRAKVLILLAICAACPVSAQPTTALQLNYDLYALGFRAMVADIAYNFSPDTYRLELNLRTVGAADVIAGGNQFEAANGTFEPGRIAPRRFVSAGQWHGQKRAAGLDFTDIAPTIIGLIPPNDTEREIVPPVMRERTIDSLSVLALLLRQVASTGRCEVSARTFDARRVALYEAKTMGEEDIPGTDRSSFAGRALRCDFTSHMLAGFKAGENRDPDNVPRQGSLWLAPMAPGLARLPVRMRFATRWFGDTVMYLTSMRPAADLANAPLTPHP